MKLSSLFRKTPFHLALIAILGLLAYSNTFNVPFQWDETDLIANNSAIKDLSNFAPANLEKLGSFNRRYIGYLTFALNYKLHGLDVRGYHIFNLSVHIFNAMLVYFLVVLTFRTPFLTPHEIASPRVCDPPARNDTKKRKCHCEERSDEAIQLHRTFFRPSLRFPSHPDRGRDIYIPKARISCRILLSP